MVKDIKLELLHKNYEELKVIMENQSADVTIINNNDRTFHISTNMDLGELHILVDKSIVKWLGRKIDFNPNMLYTLMKMTQTDYLLMI